MNRRFIELRWKFFFILFGFCLAAILVFTGMNTYVAREDVFRQVRQQLEEAGRAIATSLSSDRLQRVIEQDLEQSEDYDFIVEQLKDLYQVFSAPTTPFPLSRVFVLVPEFDGDTRVLMSVPFRTAEVSKRYREAILALKESRVVYAEGHQEGDEVYYSIFCPVYNERQNIIAVIKADVAEQVVLSAMPSFWSSGLFFYLLVALIGCLILAMILSRKITGPINRYVDFVNDVAEGNYKLRLDLETHDEMEKIGHALNLMLEKLEVLIETEADRDRLQGNIANLSRVVTAAANGDFTVNADVTPGTLGVLADSFNLMIQDLSKLIREVQSASDQIEKSTREILVNTEAMATGAESQAKEVEATYNAAKEMAEILKYANVRTSQAAESARRAAEVALGGTEVVKKSIEGMHQIRERVQETARRVRALGESSTEIGEIVEVISDIANRTNLLALNATIEAARAGEAGRGFAVVADEIRILAERASQAAKDIAMLVETIRDGTLKAVQAMEQGTEEVERGTRFVDEAGSALKEIIEMVQDSSKSITEISGAFQQQAKASSDIAEAMKRTATIAQETARGARKSRMLAEQMATLSRMLNTAVSKFRLRPTISNNRKPIHESQSLKQSRESE
ncbi:MAG: methyl-accepting chemotaxis protein [Calditrichaeota bacterium]|nr:MAG: methyl-accepting chemotaxis protein [Calditrichota bacterium]